jgi:hypothetical protein
LGEQQAAMPPVCTSARSWVDRVGVDKAPRAISWQCNLSTYQHGDFMKVDRELQRTILEACKAVFPENASGDALIKLSDDVNHVTANLVYLQQHGLIDLKAIQSLSSLIIAWAKITAKGIDFLEDDGGLSAVLGVVTVKFHEDTIKNLLIDRIEKSAEPETAKNALVKQVKSLPAEGLKTLTTEALKAALTDLPNAMHRLHTWLGLL